MTEQEKQLEEIIEQESIEETAKSETTIVEEFKKYENNPELFTEDLAKALVALDEAQTKLKDLETKLAKLFRELNSDNYSEEELKYIFDELNNVYGKITINKTSD